MRTCRFLSGGRRQVNDFHVPDDLFGFEMGPTRHHSAEAACRTSVIRYRHRPLEVLAANNQDIALRLFAQAVRSLSRAQDHAVLLGRYTAIEAAAIAPSPRALLLALAQWPIRLGWFWLRYAGWRDGWRGLFVAWNSARYPLAVQWRALRAR